MEGRLFRPAEVNLLIPELEGIIKTLRSLDAELQGKVEELKRAKVEARRRREPPDESAFIQKETEIDFLRVLARGEFERVHELGGEIKQGYLIDFPARIEGQYVLLCWKPGESSVRWYHGLYEGAMSRKPIPDELLSEEGAH